MGRLLRGLRRFSWQHMDGHRVHPEPPPQPHRQLGHLHQPSYPINTSTNSKPKPPTLFFSLTTLALATGIYATIPQTRKRISTQSVYYPRAFSFETPYPDVVFPDETSKKLDRTAGGQRRGNSSKATHNRNLLPTEIIGRLRTRARRAMC